MIKKRPYFMKNKTWYYKTELGGKVTFKLTELGISIPKVMKSYMEYYEFRRNIYLNIQLIIIEKVSLKRILWKR